MSPARPATKATTTTTSPSVSANRNGCAESGYAVLSEAFDSNPVPLSDIQRAQLECRPLVMEALIRLVQLVRRDPPPNVVADDVGDRSPGDRRVALIAIATGRQGPRRRRGATVPVTEHP